MTSIGQGVRRGTARDRATTGAATTHGRWTRLATPLAGLASAVYALLGAWWLRGGANFPFGSSDPGAVVNALGGLEQPVGGALVASVGAVGAVVAVAMLRGVSGPVARRLVTAWALGLGLVLVLVVPDYRLVAAVAYLPLFVVGAPFGWPGGSWLDAISWPLVNQAILVAVGMIWLGAGVVYRRATNGACVYCGRSDMATGWTTPRSAARLGRRATAVAIAIPLVYAATRLAWAAGIPFGLDENVYAWGMEIGLWTAGAGLAAVAIGGAALTLGLVLPFGERVPRWLPALGGRDVPAPLAVVPALVVAALVGSAGLMFVRLVATGTIEDAFGFIGPRGESWAALAPELLWPLWGVALAAAALAYHFRRRAPCRVCGRGEPTDLPR